MRRTGARVARAGAGALADRGRVHLGVRLVAEEGEPKLPHKARREEVALLRGAVIGQAGDGRDAPVLPEVVLGGVHLGRRGGQGW